MTWKLSNWNLVKDKLFCGSMSVYFKLFLVDHPLRNCQPYESETGHNILNRVLTYGNWCQNRKAIKVILGDLKQAPPY